MSLIPPIEIGLLNLWICTVLIFLMPVPIALYLKTGWKRGIARPQMSVNEKIIYNIWISLHPLIFIYSIFVPLVFKSIWFYPGLALFILGAIIQIPKNYDYYSTPKDMLITKGVYKISRNPDYFSGFLFYMGMGLMGECWPLLFLAIVHFFLYQITVKYEERMCTKLWPDEFPEYKKKVAKNFLFF